MRSWELTFRRDGDDPSHYQEYTARDEIGYKFGDREVEVMIRAVDPYGRHHRPGRRFVLKWQPKKLPKLK